MENLKISGFDYSFIIINLVSNPAVWRYFLTNIDISWKTRNLVILVKTVKFRPDCDVSALPKSRVKTCQNISETGHNQVSVVKPVRIVTVRWITDRQNCQNSSKLSDLD